MRPRRREAESSGDLFRARLDQIINLRHELVLLAERIDWAWIDAELAGAFSERGRPGTETRFVIGLLLLKQIYGLSDEAVCERWVNDPYFQYFTGESFFRHALPHERSGLSHWRKRLGERLEILLAESLRVAHDSGALKKDDLARITVDTTVQPKNVTHPTDAKLMLKAIEQLAALARAKGLRLRQSYLRVAKRAAVMAGRYAHAKQFKRCQRELRFLRTRLGRLTRDIRRKIKGEEALEQALSVPGGHLLPMVHCIVVGFRANGEVAFGRHQERQSLGRALVDVRTLNRSARCPFPPSACPARFRGVGGRRQPAEIPVDFAGAAGGRRRRWSPRKGGARSRPGGRRSRR